MHKTTFFAAGILAIMLILLIGSAWNDSSTMDELAHIPSGYSYITQRDMRLNPEHPPLLKDLAGLSAFLAVRPNFPLNTPAWQKDINGQWTQGAVFLYESGNDADRIIFWSRFPLMLLTVLFGWLLFAWTRKRFGSSAALLALAFFAFSPTILAHGRYVTTDIGASLGFFIGIVFFLWFLENPSSRNAILTGIIFGLAQLMKFSLVLLAPIYFILILAYVLTRPRTTPGEYARNAARILGKTVVIGIIALALIWAVYLFHTWNYPQDRQLADAQFLLQSHGIRPAVEFDLALIKNLLTRPLGQYLLGVLMVQQRSAGGNTAFFLDEVSSAGSRLYFPLLYLVKEPLALHILTLIALGAALGRWRRKKSFEFRSWIARHFTIFAAIVFIAFYWLISIKSPLNIGIRHVLPTFPFIYLLVAIGLTRWLEDAQTNQNAPAPVQLLKNIAWRYARSFAKYGALALALLWLVASAFFSFPSFLSYYNILAGGTAKGWRIAVDSNYDWGQDLRRLTEFVEKNSIEKISLDYFGGGSPRYYLGDRFEPWQSARGPAHGYFAISSTFRQGAFGVPAPGFVRTPADSYEWLKPYEPIAQIGHSIFVYDLP